MMGYLFGKDFITQKYLRRYPDSGRSKLWAGKMVHIQTENGVWRTGGSGYTYAGKPDAWVLPFEDAVKQIAHCGPEKCGKFLAVLAADGEKLRAMTGEDHVILCGIVANLEEERDALGDKVNAIRKVRDGYASQARFADIGSSVHFREFVRRIDAALATSMVQP